LYNFCGSFLTIRVVPREVNIVNQPLAPSYFALGVGGFFFLSKTNLFLIIDYK
jgi:hypothetical protein